MKPEGSMEEHKKVCKPDLKDCARRVGKVRAMVKAGREDEVNDFPELEAN
jgi:hypothetical protein